MPYRRLSGFALVCCFVFLIHSAAEAAVIPTDDVIAILNASDVMVGFGKGYMGWNQTLTRAQAVKVIVTAMSYEDRARESVTVTPRFPDAGRDHWAFRFINLACELGIVKGFPDGTFKPEKPVTRAEYLVMLARMYRVLGGPPAASPASLSIEPSWMAEEVSSVPDLISVLQAGQGESFDTDISRAEAATLIYGLMDRFGLTYDLAGTVVDISSEQLVVVAGGSNERIVLRLSPDTRYIRGTEEVAVGNLAAGNQVRIILGKGGTCALVRID